MKLRNKKTGEVVKLVGLSIHHERLFYELEDENGVFKREIDSLAGFNKEWEDYTPKEPLIKDKKIRKAIRAWAEACGLKYVTYKQASNEFYDADTRGAFAIKFNFIPVEVYLEDGENYTIAELCGEEKE